MDILLIDVRVTLNAVHMLIARKKDKLWQITFFTLTKN